MGVGLIQTLMASLTSIQMAPLQSFLLTDYEHLKHRFSFFLSSGALGKIKLNLTPLPRDRVECQFNL